MTVRARAASGGPADWHQGKFWTQKGAVAAQGGARTKCHSHTTSNGPKGRLCDTYFTQ